MLKRKGSEAVLDLLIKNTVIITMAGRGVGLIPRGNIGIRGNRIEVVSDADEPTGNQQAHRVIDGTNKVVLPGLIDAHIHTGIALLRGLAQDTDHWMQKALWPFAAALTPEGEMAGSLVNIIEGVKAGTTTFGDYDSSMADLLRNHDQVGTRARVAETINEMPDKITDLEVGEPYPLDAAIGQRQLQSALDLFEQWHDHDSGRITCMFGPQGPDMISKELLLEIRELAAKYDTQIHMHVAQGDREIDQMTRRYGKRSIPWLEELGLLDSRLLAVHLTEATDEETRLLAQRGSAMVLCSGSIGIIDGIIPPAAQFLSAGGKLALGSDQAPGNNCSNMFNEMKFTAILNKCKAEDPRVFPAWKVLRLATIEGARAIGLSDQIGSLQPGKKADIIIVDLDSPAMCPAIMAPARNIVPNLVYSANGSEVQTVIVDGRIIMEDRKLVNVDEKQETASAREAAQALGYRARPGKNSVAMQMMEKEQL